MTKPSARSPTKVDLVVGSRIRLQRQFMNMSQEELGEALGITFQQVQKYERGANRVSASRLFLMSRVLKVPIGWFFAGLQENQSEDVNGLDGRLSLILSLIQSREGPAIIEAFMSISLPDVRRRVLDIIASLSADE